jgi:hypothetical protein
MNRSIYTASLLALALALAPIATAGEGHSCCKKGDKAAAAKCDPKNCPPEKCDKDKAAKCDHAAKGASTKSDTAKPAPKPAA